MSLDLPSLYPQVKQLGQLVARHHAHIESAVPEAFEALKTAASLETEGIHKRLASAGPRWTGALPTEEPLDLLQPCPTLPDELEIIAADGSQVYPDRHSPVYYFLINVGSIRMQLGSGSAPETRLEPLLRVEGEAFNTSDEDPFSGIWINGQRDVAEMTALADWAENSSGPAVAFLDNSLLLWIALRAPAERSSQVDKMLAEYLAAVSRIQRTDTALAGFIDRPRSGNVLSMLDRLQTTQLIPKGSTVLKASALTDRHLFAEHLPPGHRSARFILSSPLNEHFTQKGHQVQFFYLNVGASGNIVRIELPAWAGNDPTVVDRIHSAIVSQCRETDGFPYSLARAHELAVITQSDRQIVEELLSEILAQHGVVPLASAKAVSKTWIGGRQSHRV